jgi:hypothetical protein
MQWQLTLHLETPLHLVLVKAQGGFLKQTIDIELFIAQGFGGVFMFVLVRSSSSFILFRNR